MITIGGGRVVTPGGVLEPGWIAVDSDRLARVAAGDPPGPVDLDLAGAWVLPGFVDIHVHGGAGGGYPTGDAEQVVRAAEFHLAHGTTTTMASLVSAGPDALKRQVATLLEAVRSGTVAGIHLEGPWLSTAKRGAHAPELLRSPTPEEVGRLLELGDGAIRMVTIAPELEGATAAIERLVAAGVVVAVGHTDATYDQARAALDLGAGVATHLYNAMPSMHHRAPGPVAALLEDSRAVVELVADGHHVEPAMLDLAIRAAGTDRVALVTDAVAAAGMPDGQYDVGGRPVRVSDGLVKLVNEDSIAGSTLTMDAALRFVVDRLGLAVETVSPMLSANPARALGLTDVGALTPGLRADLVVLDEALAVQRVMVAGRWRA